MNQQPNTRWGKPGRLSLPHDGGDHSFGAHRNLASSDLSSKSASTQRSASPIGKPLAPSSALLQDLLREKKAEKRAASRASDALRIGNLGHTQDETVHSSPVVASGREKASHLSQSNQKEMSPAGAGGMGVKEMEQYISKLHKLNFDLKLELYHRREKMILLEQEVAESQSLVEENAELQEVNEQLLQELEKRDRAVEEAVAIICDLEGKLEDAQVEDTTTLQLDSANTKEDESPARSSSPASQGASEIRPQTPAHDGRQHASPQKKTGLSQAIPARLIDIQTPVAKSAQRVPSFLHSECGSTGALRSLYLTGEENYRGAYNYTPLSRMGSTFRTPGSQRAMSDGLRSPTLSVLSESSFMSVYGNTKKLDLNGLNEAGEPLDMDEQQPQDVPRSRSGDGQADNHRSQTAASSVQRYLQHRTESCSPSSRHARHAPKSGEFLSFGEIEPRTDEPRPASIEPVHHGMPPPPRPQENVNPSRYEKRRRSLPQGAPMYSQAYLPPTPDTMSTVDQEGFNGSSSIITEKSLLDGSPAPFRHFNALSPNGVFRQPSLDLPDPQPEDLDHWSRGMDFDAADLSSLDGEPESVYAGDVVWGQYTQEFQPATMGMSRDLMFNGDGIDELACVRAERQPATPKPYTSRLVGVTSNASAQPNTASKTDEATPSSRHQHPLHPSITANTPSARAQYSSRHHPSATITHTIASANRSRTTPSTPTASSFDPSQAPTSSFSLRTRPHPPSNASGATSSAAAPTPSPSKRTSSLKARIFGRRSPLPNFLPSAGLDSQAVSLSPTPPRSPRHHRTVGSTAVSSARTPIQRMASQTQGNVAGLGRSHTVAGAARVRRPTSSRGLAGGSAEVQKRPLASEAQRRSGSFSGGRAAPPVPLHRSTTSQSQGQGPT